MAGAVDRPDVVEPEVGRVGGQQQVGEEAHPDDDQPNGGRFPPRAEL